MVVFSHLAPALVGDIQHFLVIGGQLHGLADANVVIGRLETLDAHDAGLRRGRFENLDARHVLGGAQQGQVQGVDGIHLARRHRGKGG